MIRKLLFVAGALLLLGAASASAQIVVDLRTSGSSDVTGDANDALFFQDTDQSSGTGFWNPFLRLQDSPIEEGFNTDFRENGQAVLDDKSDPNYTHSLQLGDLLSVEVDGKDYYLFALDIDEPNSGPKRFISLDEVKIYLGDAPDLNTLSGLGAPVWDLDGAGDAVVYLNGGALSPGNGGDDMQMLVPTSFFAGQDLDSYLYFYCKLGVTQASDNFDADASFEEWRALTGTPPVQTPEPNAMLLFGTGLIGLVGLRARKK